MGHYEEPALADPPAQCQYCGEPAYADDQYDDPEMWEDERHGWVCGYCDHMLSKDD